MEKSERNSHFLGISGGTPIWLRNGNPYTTKLFLKEALSKNTTKQKRGFSVVGPATWNKLPLELRLLQHKPGSTALFKRELKTHLFLQKES
ncbi:MAG: hypothetical protein WAX04_07485 [Oscillospiraceae bacterium]